MSDITLITYNIDGLPDKIDLKDLPWYLKPLCWVYKLIKGTTEIIINDGSDRKAGTVRISSQLSDYNADIIGVQEDFNYHEQLMTFLRSYNDSTHTGTINPKNVKLFPYPHFNADGLNLLTNNRIKVNEECIIPWDKSCGYFKHANDKLTKKGFRFYNLTIDNTHCIDLYIAHLDADFQHIDPNISKDVEARKYQLRQIADYIRNRYNKGIVNPIIIAGDINSTDNRQCDIDNIQSEIFSLSELPGLDVKEAKTDKNGIDRVFYINNEYSKQNIRLTDIKWGDKCASDHSPLITKFTIE